MQKIKPSGMYAFMLPKEKRSFIQFALPSSLIRHEDGRTDLKTPAFRVCADRKHFENGIARVLRLTVLCYVKN